ncbi:unnamed protein product [Darwinula stevensoni]|uniref:Protein kinase domain-containing protein n=1 Tax=Darwinula stevensoni TaxID=69355 RepID=A0A7R9A5C2_9CRUS|nr:unnamed protein product [Darwinula stevensoni]CAG0891722.1 unnamed protein product [Darwinula stevensoni]
MRHRSRLAKVAATLGDLWRVVSHGDGMEHMLYGRISDVFLNDTALLLSVTVLLSLIVVLMGCICCKYRLRGFKEFRDNQSVLDLPANGEIGQSELCIFPPYAEERLNARHGPSGNLIRGASVNAAVVNQWFENPHDNFPRSQIHYHNLIGRGWFGQVILGSIRISGEDVGKGKAAVVKELRPDANVTEQMHFLHDVNVCKAVSHPNVLGYLGHCLETEPFLILLEHCALGDLKEFLLMKLGQSETKIYQDHGILIRMARDVAAGLAAIHQHDLVHTDLACRNCLVVSDLTIKIGDYGLATSKYKGEYYVCQNRAVPIRWCAPETLRCTDEATLETLEVTKEANMWTMGVVIWEILSMGELPYSELEDEDVLDRVVCHRNYRLPLPSLSCLHRDRLYQVMQLCWQDSMMRPSASTTHNLLAHLHGSLAEEDGTSEFENRWNALQDMIGKPAAAYNVAPASIYADDSLKFESDFNLSAYEEDPLPGIVIEDPGDSPALMPNFQIGGISHPQPPAVPVLDTFAPNLDSINLNFSSEFNQMPSILLNRRNDSIIDPEDEIWRRRVERGEFSEKVRQKSQSVQDFMKLIHIENSSSSGEQSEDVSPETSFRATGASDGNLTDSTLKQDFLSALEELHAISRSSKLGSRLSQSVGRLNEDGSSCDSYGGAGSLTNLVSFSPSDGRSLGSGDQVHDGETSLTKDNSHVSNCSNYHSSSDVTAYVTAPSTLDELGHTYVRFDNISSDLDDSGADFLVNGRGDSALSSTPLKLRHHDTHVSHEPSVILGPSDDYGLDYFQAVKTSHSYRIHPDVQDHDMETKENKSGAWTNGSWVVIDTPQPSICEAADETGEDMWQEQVSSMRQQGARAIDLLEEAQKEPEFQRDDLTQEDLEVLKTMLHSHLGSTPLITEPHDEDNNQEDPEEHHDEVYVNYSSGVPLLLSPIHEEDEEEDGDKRVTLEDLEVSSSDPRSVRLIDETRARILSEDEDDDDSEDDQILVVDTETHEAYLCDKSEARRSHSLPYENPRVPQSHPRWQHVVHPPTPERFQDGELSIEEDGDGAEEICYTPDWEEGSSPSSHSSSSSVSDDSSTSGEYVYSRSPEVGLGSQGLDGIPEEEEEGEATQPDVAVPANKEQVDQNKNMSVSSFKEWEQEEDEDEIPEELGVEELDTPGSSVSDVNHNRQPNDSTIPLINLLLGL